MGAWGEGMQASDTAWDAIGSAGWTLKPTDDGWDVHGVPPKGVLDELKKYPTQVRRYFRPRIQKEPMAILGIAEYLLDAGVGLTPVRTIIQNAIREELTSKSLECWRDREARKAAILRFRDRIDGKEVPAEETAKDNEGLMSKISKYLHGDERPKEK